MPMWPFYLTPIFIILLIVLIVLRKKAKA